MHVLWGSYVEETVYKMLGAQTCPRGLLTQQKVSITSTVLISQYCCLGDAD